MALSPDGKAVVTASGEIVIVWEMATGRRVAELRGHTGTVTSVAFSHNGNSLVTVSRDHTARVWEMGTGRSVAVPKALLRTRVRPSARMKRTW